MATKLQKQRFQVPNKMNERDLEPKDQLIYLVLKYYYNSDTNKCFPSLQTIASKAGTSIPTVRESLKNLQETGYIDITRVGRKNYYTFKKYIKFEAFTPEFLEHMDISFKTKAYLVACQQFMYKDPSGIATLSYSNRTLAEKINLPESSLRKCNMELIRKSYLDIVKNNSRDIETGCQTDTKIFKLDKLGQAVICALYNHEERLQELESKSASKQDIENLRKEFNKEIQKKDKLIEQLLKEREKPKQEFMMD